MPNRTGRVTPLDQAVPTPIWQELLVGVELLCLQVSPVYWGLGLPRGDDSAVVVVPGFLGTDLYLSVLAGWLKRIGYRPYFSKIGWNAECPNLLLRQRLTATIQRARKETGRRVHLIGHSLGGVLSLAAASQMPDVIASVTTLGAPFLGIAAHPSIMRLAELVRDAIHQRHGDAVLPGCYTAACTCDFVESVIGLAPLEARRTAIYTKADGIVDWRACRTGDPAIDVEVSATHLGLAFSPIVYEVLARRLAEAQSSARSGDPLVRILTSPCDTSKNPR